MAGHIVKLTEGGFTLGGSVVIPGDNRTLEGSGLATTLTLANSVNDSAIKSTAARTGIALRNFVINGNKANQTSGNGVLADRWGQSIIEGLKIVNAYALGIYATYGSANAHMRIRKNHIETPGTYGIATDGHFQYMTIEDNFIDTPGTLHGVMCNVSTGTAKRLRILHNTILMYDVAVNVTTHGIYVLGSTGTLDTLLIAFNEIFRRPFTDTAYLGGFGIWFPTTAAQALWNTQKRILYNVVTSTTGAVAGGDCIEGQGARLIVVGNVAALGRSDGIVLAGAGTNFLERPLVANNFIHDCTGLGMLIGVDGQSLYGAYRGRFVNNEIVNCGRAGIANDGTQETLFQGNFIEACGGGAGFTEPGMWFRDSSVEVSKNNRVFSNYFGGNNTFGIEEREGSDLNRYRNNEFTGNGIAPAVIIGPNSRVQRNEGFWSEYEGTGTIPSGSTSVDITHSLQVPPKDARHVKISPTNNPTTDPGNMWVSITAQSLSPTATLNGAINASQTSVVYTSTGDPMSAGSQIVIESEQMMVTAVNTTTNTLTVIRGLNGTTEATHADTTEIKELTKFTVNCRTNPGATGLTFGWQVQRELNIG